MLAVIAAFKKHSLHPASQEAAVICVFLYLPDPPGLYAILAQNTYLTSDPWIERVLLSVITCGLCCLLVCGLVFFTLRVCVLQDGVAGADKGNNPTGNLAFIKDLLQASHVNRDFTLLQPQWSFLG